MGPHLKHYNKILKNNAWLDIANGLDSSVDECRKKNEKMASLKRERSKHTKSMETGKGYLCYLVTLLVHQSY